METLAKDGENESRNENIRLTTNKVNEEDFKRKIIKTKKKVVVIVIVIGAVATSIGVFFKKKKEAENSADQIEPSNLMAQWTIWAQNQGTHRPQWATYTFDDDSDFISRSIWTWRRDGMDSISTVFELSTCRCRLVYRTKH